MPDPDRSRTDRRQAQIERINEISQLARTAWFTLLAYLVFVGITLLGVEEADFFVSSRQTQLPLINVAIPTASFFWSAPVLGAALFTYLHLLLIKLWDAHHPPTRDSDPTHQWLVNDFVLIRQGDPVARARPLSWLTVFITRLLVWAAGPLVLAYAWWRSMPAHDEWLTLLIAACLGVTLYVGFTSWARVESRLRPWREPWWRGWRKWTATVGGALLLVAVSWLRTEGGLDHHVNRLIEATDALFGTALLKDCTVHDEGSSTIDRARDDCLFANDDQKNPIDVQRDRIAASAWVPKLCWFTLTHEHWGAGIWLDEGETWNPLARTHLEGAELVDLPSDWRDPEVARAAFRKTWCEREGLPMPVCDQSASPGRDEPVSRQAARMAWCAQHAVVELQACLTQFTALETRAPSQRHGDQRDLPHLLVERAERGGSDRMPPFAYRARNLPESLNCAHRPRCIAVDPIVY
jgi:hypothetical protein